MSNKHASARFFELYGKQHDVEGCTPLFTDDAKVFSAAGGGLSLDKEGYKQLGYAFLGSFPDLNADIVEQIEEGDAVVTRVVWSGTHTGMLNNVAPTGRTFRNESIFIDHFRDGMIFSRIESSDNMAFAQQLGLAPPSQG